MLCCPIRVTKYKCQVLLRTLIWWRRSIIPSLGFSEHGDLSIEATPFSHLLQEGSRWENGCLQQVGKWWRDPRRPAGALRKTLGCLLCTQESWTGRVQGNRRYGPRAQAVPGKRSQAETGIRWKGIKWRKGRKPVNQDTKLEAPGENHRRKLRFTQGRGY